MGVIRLAQWVWKLRDELRDPCLEEQKDGKEGEGENNCLLMMPLRERSVCVCVYLWFCILAFSGRVRITVESITPIKPGV